MTLEAWRLPASQRGWSSVRELEDATLAVSDLHSDTYLHSALYYMLTGRRGAWLYRGYHSSLVACMHPQTHGRVLLFPELEPNSDFSLTKHILEAMRMPPNGLELGRYTADQLARLRLRLASIGSSPLELSLFDDPLMDWRYPVHILDTRLVSCVEGHGFAKIRNKIRRAKRNGLRASSLNVAKMLWMIKHAFSLWEKNKTAKVDHAEDVSGLYSAFFSLIQYHDLGVEGLVFTEGERPLGFAVWDGPYGSTANLLINISDPSITGLADFQIVTVCKRLLDRGVSYLNVGGSERKGLDLFKAKFAPVNTIFLFSVLVSPLSRSRRTVLIGKKTNVKTTL